MRASSFYRAEADHARRLAEITIQPNLEEELRRVADELDRLADAVASDVDFDHLEIREHS
jgi:hypothetical protein